MAFYGVTKLYSSQCVCIVGSRQNLDASDIIRLRNGTYKCLSCDVILASSHEIDTHLKSVSHAVKQKKSLQAQQKQSGKLAVFCHSLEPYMEGYKPHMYEQRLSYIKSVRCDLIYSMSLIFRRETGPIRDNAFTKSYSFLYIV